MLHGIIDLGELAVECVKALFILFLLSGSAVILSMPVEYFELVFYGTFIEHRIHIVCLCNMFYNIYKILLLTPFHYHFSLCKVSMIEE